MFGQNVAQVCAVEDVFKCGEDADPDGRAISAINESRKRRRRLDYARFSV